MIKTGVLLIIVSVCVIILIACLPNIVHNIGYYRMRDVRKLTYKAHNDETYAKSLLSEEVNEPFHIISGDLKDINHKNVFCFSLYGNREEYKKGTLRLINDIAKYFPSWYSALFISHDCAWLDTFKSMLNNNLMLFVVKDNVTKGSATGMFWRFLPLSLYPNRMFVLDVDDKLDYNCLRKLFLKWEESDHQFVRILQSNPSPWPKEHIHCASWGMKGQENPLFTLNDIAKVKNREPYGIDEIWLSYNLRDHIRRLGILTGYPSLRSKFIYHTSYGNGWKKEKLIYTPFSTTKSLEDVTPDSFWKKHVI